MSYTFTATATNNVGTSASSSASAAVTPLATGTSPGAPTNIGVVAGDAKLTVRFSIVEQNLDRIKHIALAVSDPTSPVYGDFPTQQQIDDIVAPKAEDVAAVTDWLRA